VRAFDFVGARAMRLWRRFKPVPSRVAPRRILVVQLDHLGDAVLTTPLLARLRAAYPAAAIDVLASASNHEVFAADPNVDRVRLAEKSWFDRRRGRCALLSAVWALGRSLRGAGYDLGIDVRGDILSVLVLALAGIPRRVGWTMGGGGFLLTDVAEWVPGRHEVGARLALLDALNVPADGPARVMVHVSDADRIEVARLLREVWPDQVAGPQTAASRTPREALVSQRHASARHAASRVRSSVAAPMSTAWDEPDWLHAGRFASKAPLLAVHPGAGTAAKRWPPGHWRTLVERFLADGWRVAVVGGPEDVETSRVFEPHRNLCDWTGRLSVTQTTALLERADLFIGADSGPSHLAASAGVPSVVLFSGTNLVRQWRPWSRRSLVLRSPVPCRPCHQKTCPLAGHPCMTGLDPDRVFRSATRWWGRLHRRESPHAPL
jgi:heptosyltransferase-2